MDAKVLFEEHYDDLLRYLTRYTGDPEEAADAAQEAYARLVTRPPAGTHNLRAWLFTVATNVVRDNWKRARRAKLWDETQANEDAVVQPTAIEQSEHRLAVREMLSSMSDQERTLLLMWAEGFKHREIAEAVGTTTKSIGTMIARALKKLSKKLEWVAELE